MSRRVSWTRILVEAGIIVGSILAAFGIDAWWHIGIIFVTGAIAMFAFAALVQHHVLTRNRWYESVLLLATVLIILRPDLAPISKFACYAIGTALFAAVHALQWQRLPVASLD